MRMTGTFRSSQRSSLLQAAKSAAATAAAWLAAGAIFPGPPPVFAAIAALLVVQPSLNQSFSKAIERTVGVIVGVVVAALLGIALGDGAWVVVAAIALALLLAWALRMTPGTGNQVAISAMLVLALGTATPGYAVDRVAETLLGAAIGFVVNFAIVPPVAVVPARRSLELLSGEVAASLERLAGALSAPPAYPQVQELLVQCRLLRPMRDAAERQIADARDSLALNPRGRHHRDELADLQQRLDRLGPIVTQVIGMTRAFADHGEASVADDPAVQAIAEQLRRAAHDVRLPSAPPDDEGLADPALTTPLVVVRPPVHWVLAGALLEDLRRIHDALREDA